MEVVNKVDFELQLKEAADIIVKYFDPIAIYLFGSASRNELRKDSDIDLGFLTDYNAQIDEYDKFIKAQELADIFKRDVDLVHVNSASSVFKVQITYNGKLIYCSNNNKRMAFEMRTLKEYAILNEERKEIVDNIRESGTVYGRK
ncbi:type VII toxin-antitoxin system MntA family adenylyltransferase antitoxin [Clostridium neonatale]|uniref:type VII toxin-antitoxin system MntA family adenylyltransferase antitoxin n=1 Tax=Clostridium neonatale TaxID=137838 RepID=UPI00290C9F1A|nr:nucleotidyltransferase domain-containing protein [Clostridium neonatale]MDU4476809.1 nucleotidyltransferase domain-containing protein [Clostridium sp.]CAI3645645.1 putative nucleotidyltransferase [Clostridium neonatale]CAI3722609.1 putative nucleotidyltransferase [Clostridium neonatale]CAI3725070.1 putative nucleotidyltransferase [Clostridium neonatale]